MNTKLLLTIVLLSASYLGLTQQLFIDTYVEKTHVSPKGGTQVGFAFTPGFEVGGFYQIEAEMLESNETVKPRFYEKEFYGVFLSGPVMKRNKFDLNLHVRTGVSNKVSFGITPSMIGNIKVLKLVHLQAGVGVRAFRPTYRLGIRLNLQ